MQLEQGDLASSSHNAHQGTARARRAGLGLARYGIDLQYLHYLAHFADGDWDHAQEIADGFTVRVTGVAEARLSAMALFISVARGSQSLVAERGRWLEPMLARDEFTEYITRGLLAEHAYWQGDTASAVEQTRTTIRAAIDVEGGHLGPPVIRVAAIGLGAVADQAALARAGGELDRLGDLLAQAGELLQVAREGAAYRLRPGFALGVDGRGWLAKAEAEALRANGENDPVAWRAVVTAFGPAVLAGGDTLLAGGHPRAPDGPDPPGFVYETARARWRLAAALAEAGDRAGARAQWLLATQAAGELGAAPLRGALADLGRRARIGDATRADEEELAATGRPWRGRAGRGPLAGLTDRELEVLRLLATGQSNKEIGAELFISPKTASVHVSNILGKLNAASRTEAAAIAHREGLTDRPARR